MGTDVVIPGSFDPIHNGHVDVVERAARRFDRVVVAVLVNPRKQGMFTVDERMELIRASLADLDNLEVDSFSGLLVDYCNQRGIGCIAKGLRAVADFEYEVQMAQMNAQIGDVETLFLPASPASPHLSSSLVKEVARFGGPIDQSVPAAVAEALRARIADTEG